MAALSNQEIRIQNAGTGKDCNIMIDCLRKLGVWIDKLGDEFRIFGMNGKLGKTQFTEIYVGNSGTTSRFLLSGLALLEQDFSVQI